MSINYPLKITIHALKRGLISLNYELGRITRIIVQSVASYTVGNMASMTSFDFIKSSVKSKG